MRFGIGAASLACRFRFDLFCTRDLGLVLRESSQQLTIIWPRRVAVLALWFSPRRNWIWIGGYRSRELVIDLVRFDHITGASMGHSSSPTRSTESSVRSLPGRLMARRKFPASGMWFSCSRRWRSRRGSAWSALWCGAAFGRRPLSARVAALVAGNWLGSLCLTRWVMGWRFGATRPNSPPVGAAADLVLIGCALLYDDLGVFRAARQSPCGPRFAGSSWR